jgi:hypothetical protein
MLYPNPVKDILKLSGVNAQHQLMITDIMGRVMYSGPGKEELDVSNLPSSLYLLTVTGDTKRTFRFVKQ